MYKYCVAQLYVNCLGETMVTYGAYSEDAYGSHWTVDWNEDDVLWYNTEGEAKAHICNSNECVVCRYFEK